VLCVGLDPPRDTLRARVVARTDVMLAGGLVEEVRRLVLRFGEGLRPLRAIGYRQALAVLRGEQDLASARRDIVTETMQYAKRQRTWFRHQADVTWCGGAEEAARRIGSFLA
jgi:tRNA dimethylallyltransferase